MVNALDSDALYSRIDPSDLDMVKIEAKLPLYDHNSCSASSCSKKDDLEALTFNSDTKDFELNLYTHGTLKRNLWTKKLTRMCLQWNVVPGMQNTRILPCTLPMEGVT